MPHCLISLGSNLGNRRRTLEEALAELGKNSQIQVIAVSSFHETLPVGGPADQPLFLNAVCVVDCSLEPSALLDLLLQIENKHGRSRKTFWGPRTLDLDLLLYDNLVMSTPRLDLPHPRMAWRRFVLEPAAEVAGEMRHPVIGWTINQLLAHLNTALPYAAITGSIAAGKTQLAQMLCKINSMRLISKPVDSHRLESFYADPAGQAWDMELEFLNQRSALLASDAPVWSDWAGWIVSDFWFDQSMAFARTWLDNSQLPAYHQKWQKLREKIVKPKLLVLLDAPAETLLDRIRRRARPGEQHLTLAQIDSIQQAIFVEAAKPDVGPALRPKSAEPEIIFTEISAAIQAMI